jgi:pyruvate-formate lyase
MKFHPSALKTTEDLRKLSFLIRSYMNGGGKHIQFDVVDKQTLIEAQQQDEIIRRTEVESAG